MSFRLWDVHLSAKTNQTTRHKLYVGPGVSGLSLRLPGAADGRARLFFFLTCWRLLPVLTARRRLRPDWSAGALAGQCNCGLIDSKKWSNTAEPFVFLIALGPGYQQFWGRCLRLGAYPLPCKLQPNGRKCSPTQITQHSHVPVWSSS
ncbi:uncharacterized protein PGTG_03440 [Puccinia graminis f. sp. tritici CRL 75-36-700-3]|uniref:Uncharacterized protein n=1 Tax=Puccinia graminis f. sp. tritici (strain CRL 75-36-700-3 / race SCCL) TaxID=418459 RepID=E3JZK9_PUCGT|nr:uncharacterized protein PGTG_03440 [Puccinia graminis f. sp. tritici CRL 75-36-700-3]EFP77484.2 hypothetical protein PGTG_03440 [Puccinia graminis f. sp. tritici CRL 75-36-700-3]